MRRLLFAALAVLLCFEAGRLVGSKLSASSQLEASMSGPSPSRQRRQAAQAVAAMQTEAPAAATAGQQQAEPASDALPVAVTAGLPPVIGVAPLRARKEHTSPASLPSPSSPLGGSFLSGCTQPQPQFTSARPLKWDDAVCGPLLRELAVSQLQLRDSYDWKLIDVSAAELEDELLLADGRRGPMSLLPASSRLIYQLWYAESLVVGATGHELRNYAGRMGGADETWPSLQRFQTKRGFLSLARAYSRSRGCAVDELQPYSVDLARECRTFLTLKGRPRQLAEKTRWIYKPSEGQGGDGLKLMSYAQMLAAGCGKMKGIAQRYLASPALIAGRKFDLRSYVLVANFEPAVVFYKHGFVRVALPKYSPNSSDRRVHLVNSHVQKARSDCDVLIHWQSPRQLGADLARRGVVPDAHAFDAQLLRQAKQLSLAAFRLIRPALDRRHMKQRFMMLGVDIMLDEQLRPWLIEVNPIAAVSRVSDYMFKLMGDASKEKMDILAEVDSRLANNQPLRQFCTPRTFELLLSEDASQPWALTEEADCFQPSTLQKMEEDDARRQQSGRYDGNEQTEDSTAARKAKAAVEEGAFEED